MYLVFNKCGEKIVDQMTVYVMNTSIQFPHPCPIPTHPEQEKDNKTQKMK